jgi:hypothetical protein
MRLSRVIMKLVGAAGATQWSVALTWLATGAVGQPDFCYDGGRSRLRDFHGGRAALVS